MAPGSGRDLNLMWDRTRATGSMDVVTGTRDVGAPIAFAVALGGPASVTLDGATFALGEQDALRIDGGGALTVTSGEIALAEVS